jgi:hypothetical protein
MTSLALAIIRLFIGIGRGLRDPEFGALLVLLSFTVLGGTVFYRIAERWDWINALYFSVITLVTLEDSRLHPTTDFAKIFTIIYVLGGIGLMLAFVTRLATFMVPGRDQDKPPNRTSNDCSSDSK